MKRFLLNLFGFCGVVGVLSVVIICCILPGIELYTIPFSGWYSRCLSVSVPSEKPKLVLVGGSNLACGVDAALLSRELGGRYEVVNLGFHAGLGVGLHLDLIEKGLHRGDCVVLAVEYQNWSRWNGALPATIFKCDVRGRNLLTADLDSKWSKIPLAEWHHYVMTKIRKVTGGAQLFAAPPVKTNAVTDKNNRPATNEPTDDDRPTPGYVNSPVLKLGRFKIDDESKRRINELVRTLNDSGVHVLLSAPTYDKRFYELYQAEIESIYAYLGTIPNFQQITKPSANAYPLEEMGNSSFHLNRLGRIKHTKSLARDIEYWESSNMHDVRNIAK